MSEAAVAADPSDGVVGKKQLCAELRWSRMKLDRRLLEDAAFPVRTRGNQGGGWEFDLAAVLAYLQPERPERAEPAEAEPDAPARIDHGGEVTARQRRDAAQAQLLEDKIRRSRGELVDANALRLALAESVSRTGVALNSLGDVLVRRLNLPESALPIIRQEVDGIRRTLVTGLREHLADG